MKKFAIAVLTSLLLMAYTPEGNRELPLPTKVENRKQQINPSDSQAFRDAVKRKIKSLGIKHPEIVYAQFREESGNGGSYLAKTQFNLFGMKYPTKRETTAIGKGKGGYAIYKSWQDAVKDYKMFQDRYYKNLSRTQYMRKLRTSYTKDPNYLKNYF